MGDMAHNADRALAKPPGIVGPSTHPGGIGAPPLQGYADKQARSWRPEGAETRGIAGCCISSKSSRLRNHPFVDGNKRTSWASANVFLHINGIMPTVDLDVDRAEVFVNDVAKGVIDEWADIADGLHYLYGLSHRSLPINSPVKDDRRER